MRSKYIPILLNLVIVLTGMSSIGIGVYVKIQSEPYLDLVKDYGMIFISWGVAICVWPFLLSLVSQESDSMNSKLRLFLAIIFGFGYIYVFAMTDDISFRNVVEKNMVSGLEKYGKEGHGGISATWDLVQRDFHCCGVTNFMDWSGVGNYSEGQTPDSCCKKVPEVAGCGLITDAATKNKGGCLKELDFLTYINIPATLLSLVAFFVIFLVIILCYILHPLLPLLWRSDLWAEVANHSTTV